jgi:tetratricopeptide (TPR) repeat protein
MMKEYDKLAEEIPVPTALKHEMAHCLLSASRFLDHSWKIECIDRTKDLLAGLDDCYMNAAFMHRKSALLRLQGKRQESQDTLEQFVHAVVLPEHDSGIESDARWNAQRGYLVVSYAENLIQADQLAAAEKELLAWEPLNPGLSSMMECLVLRSRNTNIGRVLRDRGAFPESLSFFEGLHQDTLFDVHYDHTGHRRIIISNIADLYCELNRGLDAVLFVKAELDYMTDQGTENISSGRRLKLCLAEGYLRSQRTQEAHEVLSNVKEALDVIPNPDMLAKYGIFRAYCGFAQISHMEGDYRRAQELWTQALEAGQHCGWDMDYPMNIVRYSLAHAFFELDDTEQSLQNLQSAKESLSRQGQKYWSVGLCTYWYQFVHGRFQLSESTLDHSSILAHESSVKISGQSKETISLNGQQETAVKV